MKTAYYFELEWFIAIPENLSNEHEILSHFEDRFLPFLEDFGFQVLEMKNGWASGHLTQFPGEEMINHYLDEIHQEAMERGMQLTAQHTWGNLELEFENHSREWMCKSDLRKWKQY